MRLGRPVCRARGFKGDKAPVLDGIVGSGTALGAVMSPVTLRRIGGRPVGVPRPLDSNESVGLSSGKPTIGDVSFPSACLRAFSCFDCTDRK